MRKMADSGKKLMQCFVQFASGGEIAAEWFFDDDARVFRALRFCQTFRNRFEKAGWNGQIKQRLGGGAHFLFQSHKCVGIVVIAIDIAQPLTQFRKRFGINSATVFFMLAFRAGDELFHVPSPLLPRR